MTIQMVGLLGHRMITSPSALHELQKLTTYVQELMNTLHYNIRLMIYIYNSLSKAREWFQLRLNEPTSTCHIKNPGKGK